MQVLVAMSGGVDSSVAAALLAAAGHDVVGVTMKLWGGPSDSGCCSISDVDDARRVADQLGIDHHVFNFGDEFEAEVVEPYVAAHARGDTPNPCVECNRHLKFDRLLRRAAALGFDQVATGHHARVVEGGDGTRLVGRGADEAKDQSYVLYMLGQAELARVRFPVGHLTKDQVRERATDLDLRTATKPDSQDVCFITSHEGRAGFLRERLALTPGRVVDPSGAVVGSVPSVELVTVGQRKGLGLAGGTPARYAVSVDVDSATVVAGAAADLSTDRVELSEIVWADGPVEGPVMAQVSAHGRPAPASIADAVVTWDEPRRRVAPGQSVVLYDGDLVLGGGIAI